VREEKRVVDDISSVADTSQKGGVLFATIFFMFAFMWSLVTDGLVSVVTISSLYMFLLYFFIMVSMDKNTTDTDLELYQLIGVGAFVIAAASFASIGSEQLARSFEVMISCSAFIFMVATVISNRRRSEELSEELDNQMELNNQILQELRNIAYSRPCGPRSRCEVVPLPCDSSSSCFCILQCALGCNY